MVYGGGPSNLSAELPSTAGICSRRGMAAARLSSEGSSSVIIFPKPLLSWEYTHSFSHCGLSKAEGKHS